MVNARVQNKACLAGVSALLLVAGCSTTPGAPTCLAGSAMTETTLFLGMATPTGTVSPEDFAAFVESEVTPRWREGYTILEGQGLWYSDQRQVTEREPSRILLRLHDGDARSSADIEAIRAGYIRSFMQDAVLRTDRTICADF